MEKQNFPKYHTLLQWKINYVTFEICLMQCKNDKWVHFHAILSSCECHTSKLP